MTQAVQQQAEQAASLLGCDVSEMINQFDISAITTTKKFPPQKIVIYGVPGIGKTTFAATFPNPILLRTEDGADALDISTFPKIIENMDDMRSACSALIKGKHNFKTLILDSLDWTEPFVWDAVCKEHCKEGIEDFGYGKGYVHVDTKWRAIQKCFDMLRNKHGMHIVTIAHAVPITFDPPDSESYQRYTLKLHKRASALWMEWADMILFLNYRANVVHEEGKKAKAKGSGSRVIYTAERPPYQAKTRWPLDEEINIGIDNTWAAFHEQLKEATGGAYNA